MITALSLGTSCSKLSNPSNGNVNVPSRRIGSTAVYSCITGYNLVGDESRVCRSGGSWSGSAPTCEGNGVTTTKTKTTTKTRIIITSTLFFHVYMA